MVDPTPSGKKPDATHQEAVPTGEDSRNNAAKQYDDGIDHEVADPDSANRIIQEIFRGMAKKIAKGENPDPEEPKEKSWKI